MSTRQISANANDLVSMVDSFSGFTGTPWNIDAYHTKVHTQNAVAKGTEGKTIDLLIRMFESGDLVMREVKLDPENPLGSILDEVPDFMDRYDSFIDAGYYLKGVDNQDVLKLGKKKSKKKGLVSVTNENQKVIQTFGKDDAQPLQNRKDIKAEDQFSYYDHVHTIGTDIPHARTARAAVSIGEKMYIKDFFQALWRMRQIDKGQKVDLFYTDEVKELIKAARSLKHPNRNSDEITIQDVILFALKIKLNEKPKTICVQSVEKLPGLFLTQCFGN